MALCKDSKMSDEWIAQKVQQNPLFEHMSPEGKPTGIFNSGVVRLSFPHLLTPSAFQGNNTKPKPPTYSTGIWFTPVHNMEVLFQAARRIVREHTRWQPGQQPLYETPGIPTRIGPLLTPFHDQGEKSGPGYTPGSIYLNCTSTEPIDVKRYAGGKSVSCIKNVDEERIYGGMWAIVCFNLYVSRENKAEQIPSRLCAGLNNVLLFADDNRLGSQRMGSEQAFANAQGMEEVGVPTQSAAQQAFEAAGNGQMPGGTQDWSQQVDPRQQYQPPHNPAAQQYYAPPQYNPNSPPPTQQQFQAPHAQYQPPHTQPPQMSPEEREWRRKLGQNV